jgi:hypothetical protein
MGPSGTHLSVDSDMQAYARQLNRKAQAEGAPYRYRVSAAGAIEEYASADFDKIKEEVDTTPSKPSLADDELMLGIYEQISNYEVKSGSPALPDIVETRVLTKRNGYYREAWIIVSNGSVKEYLVTYKPKPLGGADGAIYPL